MVLDLLGAQYEIREVPYGDRTELAKLTGGYVYVPVLVDRGKVITESRDICEHLVATEAGARLAPAPRVAEPLVPFVRRIEGRATGGS